MDGHVDAPTKKSVFEFLRKHTLATNYRQWILPILVAGCMYDLELNFDARIKAVQLFFDPF